MSGRIDKRAFAARPSNSDTSVRTRKALSSREIGSQPLHCAAHHRRHPGTARPHQGHEFQRGQTVADMLRELLARDSPTKTETRNERQRGGRGAVDNRCCVWFDLSRADLGREAAHRALDSARTSRRGENPRSPPADRQLRAGRRLRLRALGVERLRHRRLPHRHRTRSCARRTLRDAAIRASRRRHSAADQRLAQGRSGPAGDRRGGSLRRRSRRRRTRSLAARPQSPDGRRTAPPLTLARHKAWLMRRGVVQ